MSGYRFGDDDPADVYAPGAPPAPEQVAYRLHELRAYLGALTGTELVPFDELTGPEQTLALAVGAVVVAWLVETDPDEPERAAEHLHNVRRYWSPALPSWAELPADHRAVAVDLLAAVIDWLAAEGALA